MKYFKNRFQLSSSMSRFKYVSLLKSDSIARDAKGGKPQCSKPCISSLCKTKIIFETLPLQTKPRTQQLSHVLCDLRVSTRQRPSRPNGAIVIFEF